MKKSISCILVLTMILSFFPQFSSYALNQEEMSVDKKIISTITEKEVFNEELHNDIDGTVAGGTVEFENAVGPVGPEDTVLEKESIANDEHMDIDLKENVSILEDENEDQKAFRMMQTPISEEMLTGRERFTVLVLDISGESGFLWNGEHLYTADSAVDLVVEAAEHFVENLFTQEDVDRLAIVTYDSAANTVLNFSNDKESALEQLRNIHRSEDRTRSIDKGLREANRLLRQIPKEVSKNRKNIVLISTGMTNAGNYSYQGHYDKNVIGNTWHRVSNGVKLYAYANAALSTASAIKEKATLFSIGLFQNFDQMPQEGRDVVELFRLTAKDLSSSAKHYLEVRDMNQLSLIFKNTADDILKPLDLKLTGKVAVKNQNLICKVKGMIQNNNLPTEENDGVVRNVKLSLELPDGAELFESQQTHTIESVLPFTNQQDLKEVEWTFSLPLPQEDTELEYKVHITGNNISKTAQKGLLYYEKEMATNKIRFEKDQWQFDNSYSNFSPNDDENYYISDNDWEKLVENLSDKDKATMITERNEKWMGSCYGMALSTILCKMGEYQPGELQSGRQYLYEITKEHDDNIESFINYYQLSQFLPEIDSLYANSYYMNFPDDTDQTTNLGNQKILMETEKQVKQVEHGGSPVLISFSFNDGGAHAVVGYGWEKGDFYKNNKKYDSRILIYDANYPKDEDKSCIYYNQGTSDFSIPNYDNEWGGVYRVYSAISDYKSLAPTAHPVPLNDGSSYSRLYLSNLDNVRLKIDGQPSERITSTSQGKNFFVMPVIAGHSSDMKVYFTNLNDKLDIEIPEGSQDYTLAMNANNIFLSANTSKAEKVSFDPKEGNVSIEGQKGAFEVSMAGASLEKHTTVKGTDAKELSITQTSNGVKFEADQLRDIKVAVEGSEELTLDTKANSVLITSARNGKTTILSDENKDGIFETEIKAYPLKLSATRGGKVTFSERQYSPGTLVTVEAKPNDGYIFDHWEITQGSVEVGRNAEATFNMPAESVSLVAHFKRFNKMRDDEFFNVKTITDPYYEWTIRFNDRPVEKFIDENHLFVMNEKGYRVPDITPVIDRNTIKMKNAHYEKGNTYYLVIRKDIHSQKLKLKKDVIFKFIVK